MEPAPPIMSQPQSQINQRQNLIHSLTLIPLSLRAYHLNRSLPQNCKYKIQVIETNLIRFFKSTLFLRRTRSAEFTVEYLSPLVVRKEIENIILNANANSSTSSTTAASSTISNPDDPSALVTSQFMEQHAVIFWNLVWLFKRIGVDGSYLLDSLLNSRLELHRRENPNQDEAFKVTSFLSQFQPRSNQPFSQHMHVRLTCLWDNIKLKQANSNHEIPLYISWLSSGNFSITKELERKLVTILTETELKAFRKRLFSIQFHYVF